jgi:putative ABC transport system permease protein
MLGRKLRTILTMVAIVLGVAMVSGTYVLTDSIDQAFHSIFNDVRKNEDVVISGNAATATNNGSTTPSFDAALLEKVRKLPSVAQADGAVTTDQALLIDHKGKAIVFGGAPNLGFSIDNPSSPFNQLTLIDGDWPHANEVVIDRATANKKHFKVGDPIGVEAAGPVEDLRISGLVKFGSVATIGGATLAGFDLATAQRLFDKKGRLDEIAIATKPNVSATEALSQVRSILPPGTIARTGAQQAAHDEKDVNSFISFLQKFLLAFGGVALFVGSFVIANSLSITIAQRTREFATLRTLGATRGQVRRSIFVEALVIGVLASVTGLFLGLGLAKGLFKLFDAIGFTLPNNGLIFATRTIIVSLLVGIVVTVLASLRPAFRATRVPPIAAVREGATLPESRFARFRTPGSAAMTVLGFAALIYGLFGNGLGTAGVLGWMGFGTLLIFIGVSLLSVRFVRPLVGALGWPAREIGGAAGALAQDNARRNPQRTASTAAALMIGLALVTFVAVLASGITSSFKSAVNKIWQNADYAITAQNNFSPIPVAAADAVRSVPGVKAVTNVRAADGKAFGKDIFVTGVNAPAATMFKLDWTVGSANLFRTLGDDGAFTDKGYAKKHHLTAGSSVEVTFSTGATKTYFIRGIFDPPPGGSPFGPVTISQQSFDQFNPLPKNLYSFVRMEGGQTDANFAALDKRLKSFPNAKAATRQKFIDNQIAPLKSILNVLYVLLALSVVVSLFGIVNTLILTVFERTREIGMLRAIGMTRRQVRRMIRHESVITAAIGGVLGIVLGIVLGGLLVYRVDFISFSLPVVSLIVFAIATIFVGILAAIFPARRASRLNILEALQYE